ncbi:MAG TPA: TAXI family TRAP transporter solute-binding subunit [Casimicrobiaceae bacterium]|nr:TAXI family TRAP transporter solute-binding subunit [Casimicrobiaceae bacterium]
MTLEDLAALSRRDRIRVAVIVAIAIAAAAWVILQFMQPAPSRRIVVASGPASGMYHRHAQQYKTYLAREGVTLSERLTNGAAENMALLVDDTSGVDAAFVQGGLTPAPPPGIVMIASLYFEPLWVFYRDTRLLTKLTELAGKRLAIGVPGSGTRALAVRVLAANGITAADRTSLRGTAIVDAGDEDALAALRAGSVDAILLVGSAQTPAIAEALRDPAIALLSFDRADAYPRRFDFLTRLVLPPGTVDFAAEIPREDVKLIATEAMLASRSDLHPALAQVMLDAARQVHGGQGMFEAAGEFPNVTHVDLPVSPDADRHMRFGPSFVHRYLPFWLATVVERTIVLVVPLLVLLVPLFNHLPQLLRWRIRRRIFRWYGELVLLERAIDTHAGAAHLAQWERDLDRIERAVTNIRTPPSYASEVYQLRTHVALVRRTLDARVAAA